MFHVFDTIYMLFPRLSSGVLRDSTHAVQVNYILLSKGHYQLMWVVKCYKWESSETTIVTYNEELISERTSTSSYKTEKIVER